jgi:hypothetical protein
MLGDKQLSGRVGESGKTPQSYVAHAFDLRQMRLRTGEQMMVAVATDGCTALGQSARLMIFQRTSGGHYRRVLGSAISPVRRCVGRTQAIRNSRAIRTRQLCKKPVRYGCV